MCIRDRGVDGISLWLILLTNLVFPLAIGYSFSTIKTREREYLSLIHISEPTRPY